MTQLIGLSGYARVGKDTAGEVLAPLGYGRISFADKVREVAYGANPFISQVNMHLAPLVNREGWEAAKAYPEVRIFLQNVGTTVRTILGEDVWVDSAFLGTDPESRYAVTDVRFPNEARGILYRGGIVVRIERPGYGPVNDHISEVGLDNFPFTATIVNDGTRGDLRDKLLEVMDVCASQV